MAFPIQLDFMKSMNKTNQHFMAGKTNIAGAFFLLWSDKSLLLKHCVGLFCLLVLCTACAGTSVRTAPPEKVVTGYDETAKERDAETNDRACAYFYFLWGSTAENNNRLDEALEAYQKALLCDGQSEYIRRKLAILYYKMDRLQDAADLLEQMIDDNDQDKENKILLAKIYAGMGHNDKAVAIYKDLLETKEDQDTLLMLGPLYAQNKEYDKAAQVLHRLIKLEGDSYLAYYSLARLYVELKQYDKAGESYEKALELNWFESLAYEVAEFYEKHQEYDKAVRIYKRIINEGETGDLAKTRLVNIYLTMGENDKALALLRELRTILPESHNVDMTISRILLSQEKYAEAIMILEDVLKTNPELTVVHYLLAMAYYKNNQSVKAEEQLKDIPVKSNLFEDSIFMRVRILKDSENTAGAVALLEQQIEDAATRKPNFYILLATLYQEDGDVEQGRQTYEKALKLYPKDTDVLYNYGIFLEKAGESDKAMTIMEKVISLDPENGTALNYVGYSWADKNQNLTKALKYIKKAVELMPDDGYIRDSLGWVYFKMGNITQAIIELEKAVKMVDDDPIIREHLGDVYLKDGQDDKALAAYVASYEMYEDAKKKKEVGAKISSLKSRGKE